MPITLRTIARGVWFPLMLALVMSLQGCLISYRDYPKQYTETPANVQSQSGQRDEVLRYRIDGSTIGGGRRAIEQTLRDEAPYRQVVYSETIPEDGNFLVVRMQNSPPSFPAFVFGYLSASTFLIVPAWSTTTGADLFFDLYKNGESHTTISGCELRRSVFAWLGLAPLAWINLLTNDETDVYRACTRQLLDTAFAQARVK